MGTQALVVHGVPTRISVDEILWYQDKLRLVVGEGVVRPRWLVVIERSRGKRASSLVLYFSGVVPVHGRVFRFGHHWYPVDHYKLAEVSFLQCTLPLVHRNFAFSSSISLYSL